jgi:hypothetical protein
VCDAVKIGTILCPQKIEVLEIIKQGEPFYENKVTVLRAKLGIKEIYTPAGFLKHTLY